LLVQDLQQISDDIWHVPGRPLRMPGGIVIPVASTVIRLPEGALVVYSPIEPDASTAAAIGALGPVAHLIVPSALHHLYAAAAAARWPDARVHAAPGARAKQPGLRIDRELGGELDPAWRGVLEVERIGGTPRFDEHVVFHRPSGTLVCADLVFHIARRPANLRTRAFFAVMGVGGGQLAQSRSWRFLCRDRAAARASLARVLAWPIARVAPCHGEPCSIDAAGLATRMTRLSGQRAAPEPAPAPP
jgi:hypothetical protein